MRAYLFLMSLLCSCIVFSQPTEELTDTRTRSIDTFQGRIFSFQDEGVSFLANFPTARLNKVEKQNDGSFLLFIYPENEPINPSPWYAFKVVCQQSQKLDLVLLYKNAKYRYHPKWSRDGKQWTNMDSSLVSFYPKTDSLAKHYGFNEKTQAIHIEYVANCDTFNNTFKDTLWIAAQPLVSSNDVENYLEKLTSFFPFVKKTSIGKSVLGRNIPAIYFGKKSKQHILLISRQHPPEVTGYFALQHFLSVVLNNSQLSKWYQKNFTTYVMPILNPDGVDLGHWRHNVGGIDLNRDWQSQHQPETKNVVHFMRQLSAKEKSSVIAMIDFHSTFFDVFYVNIESEKDSLYLPHFVDKVLEKTARKLQVDSLRIQPTKIENKGVSKNYFKNNFHAASFVYEIGDNTDEETIKRKGIAVAESFLEVLFALMKKKH